MQWLNEMGGLDAFFAKVRSASQRVLITDYDGTLSPFVYDRNRARPYDGVQETLERLAANPNTRVVIVTGRTVEDQRRMMDLRPGAEIWGTHGWERYSGEGRHRVWPIGEEYSRGLENAIAWATREKLLERIETKPATVALHWRSAAGEDRKRIEEITGNRFREIAADSGLLLHEFDGGLELRTPGRDKGVAVKTILSELGPDPAVVYMGDDTTDEDAFKELEGKALRVLIRTTLRETEADLWLRPPREMLRFLERMVEATKET